MATSVLTAASDHHHHHHHQTTNPSSSPSSPPQERHDNHTVRRTSGRKKQANKGSEKIKKQPQRGMGVEKLERLRLQKRWEKMTQPPTANHHHHHANFNIINTAAAATPFSDPVNLFGSANSLLPVRFGGYGAPIVGHMGLNPNPNPTQQSYHLGFHGQTAGVVGLAPDFFTKNVNLMIHNKEQLSSSSSSPNVFLNCYSEHCNSCHKKKKVINSENSGRVTRPDIYTNSGDYGFLGLSIGDNNPNSTGHETQGVEVVAVHRRGSSTTRSEGGRSTVMMEYEFFPAGKGYCADGGGGSGSSNNDDDELTAVMKMAAGGGSETTTTSSSSTMAATGFQTSDFIDLSLKLSY